MFHKVQRIEIFFYCLPSKFQQMVGTTAISIFPFSSTKNFYVVKQDRARVAMNNFE
jgi:hypothetical protein